jgi:hypothetical protein
MPTGPKGQMRPADVVSNAVQVIRVLTGEADYAKAAQELGRKGGKGRAANMTRERRAEIARKAAAKRWARPE